MIKKIIESFLLKMINVDRFLPIQIDITNLCNLRCTHCYHSHHNNVGSLSLNDWYQVLNQYKDLVSKLKYRPWVTICGGEPLTSPYLFPILEFLKKEIPTTRVSILTNGTLIKENILEKIGRDITVRFQVSLDGPDTERHDKIRGSGSFAKTILGIKLLQRHKFEVNVLSILSKNTEPWIEDFFILAKQENFNSINFTRFIPAGNGKNILNDEIDSPIYGNDLKSAYEKILKCMIKYKIKSKTQSPLFELIVPGLGRSGNFSESLVIDYQGYVIASSRSNLRLGHSIKDGIEKIFLNNSIFQSIRKKNIEGCGNCDLYSVCGGDRNAAYAESGNFLGKDPGCWFSTKNKTKLLTEGAI